ncbi:MAG: HEAT repeat domain-containing protein [Fimbriimonadales bacterium]|nr:HEAT repeat domain-containing protein [Fimbriimonadales bacterium]
MPNLPTDLESARALLQAAAQHPDALFRSEALAAIDESGYAQQLTAELLPFLSDTEPLVRVGALEALMFNTEPQVMAHLLGLAIADPEPLVRGYALTNLAYADYSWLKAFLWKAYRNDRSHYVKIRALGGLLRLGETQVYKKLMEYLHVRWHILIINAAQELTLGAARLSPSERTEATQAMRRLLHKTPPPPVSVAEALEACTTSLKNSRAV